MSPALIQRTTDGRESPRTRSRVWSDRPLCASVAPAPCRGARGGSVVGTRQSPNVGRALGSDVWSTAVTTAEGVGLALFLTAGFFVGLSLTASPGVSDPLRMGLCSGFFAWCLLLVCPTLARPGFGPAPPGGGTATRAGS
jgi:hypothetical protein